MAGITPDDAAGAALVAMSGPFGWEGASDCSATACAAFYELTGVDLMAGLRGQYHDKPSAIRLIRSSGGFRALWTIEARRVGLHVCRETAGAIGIIKYQSTRVLALCVEPGFWAAKSLNGAVFCRTKSEICWNA